MITVTSAQEAIIKDDETVKSFVVHFPNGERADLTNSDIVFESVRFTESVCSDQSFRFGAADASCIEFETVGVGNIIGLTIECSMVFTLGADSVTIPYGTFIVDSCPRDHASMVHRKVTAYSQSVNNGYISGLEKWKLEKSTRANTYTLKPYYLFAELGFITPETASTESLTTNTGTFANYDTNLNGGIYIGRTHSYYDANANYVYTVTDFNAVYKIEFTGSLTAAQTALESHNIGTATQKKILSASVYYDDGTGIVSLTNHCTLPIIDNGDGTMYCDLIYPQAPQAVSTVYIYIPLDITVKYTNSNDHTLDWTESVTVATAATLTKLTTASDAANVEVSFNSTLENSGSYTFYNAYSLADLVTGFAELNAAMVRTERDGTYTLFHLDNSAPYALTADDVEGAAWWDEYTVNSIGSIQYSFKDAQGGTVDSAYTWNADGSVYSMTGNYVLDNLSSADTSTVETYIDDLFKPYASIIQFTPLDANFRGMPYLQCGDAVQLTAADGTVIDSYFLKQTFDGIQHITEDVETVQGTVIGSEIVY